MVNFPQKAKIVYSAYREESDVIVWNLSFENGTEQMFCWPSIDLLKSLSYKGSLKLKPEHLHKFCQMMEGKEINFVLEGSPTYKNPNETEADQKKISQQISDHFGTFKKHIEDGNK